MVVGCGETGGDGSKVDESREGQWVRVVSEEGDGIEGVKIWLSYNSAASEGFVTDRDGWCCIEMQGGKKRTGFLKIYGEYRGHKFSQQRDDIGQWPLVFEIR